VNWEQAVESSLMVRLLRAALPGSAVARAPRRFVAGLPFLFRDIQSAGADFDDGPVIRVLEGSIFVRAAEALLVRIDGAARESRIVRAVSKMRERLSPPDGSQRIRLTALMLLSAVVVHLLMTGFNAPEPSAIARTVWAAVLVVLAAVMAGARSLAVAWRDWSSRRPRIESDLG
jgi:hypothetical protein